MKKIIREESLKIKDELISFRRSIHEEPELGHNEIKTSEKIISELKKLDLDEIRTGVGGHGVVGVLRGKKGEGKTLLLRADIDALPMEENSGLAYSSKIPGVMHACGHDVHTSVLLGAAKVLSPLKDEIEGNILFCFQPAEEASPQGGAQGMIDDGVLDDPEVDAAMALHVWNQPVGKIALRDGTMMAQSDRIFITINGKASHASQPEAGHDAIVAASQIVTALQTIVSRTVSPFTPLVVTIGTIHGGDRYNVLCDKVVMEGTVRVFDKDLAEKMPELLDNLIKPIAKAMGCQAEVELKRGYKIVDNDHELFELARNSLVEQLGEENVVIPEFPASGAEDFSAFGKHVPILFLWLGMESEINKGRTTLHNSRLIIDEDCIPVGVQSLACLALDYLRQ